MSENARSPQSDKAAAPQVCPFSLPTYLLNLLDILESLRVTHQAIDDVTKNSKNVAVFIGVVLKRAGKVDMCERTCMMVTKQYKSSTDGSSE